MKIWSLKEKLGLSAVLSVLLGGWIGLGLILPAWQVHQDLRQQLEEDALSHAPFFLRLRGSLTDLEAWLLPWQESAVAKARLRQSEEGYLLELEIDAARFKAPLRIESDTPPEPLKALGQIDQEGHRYCVFQDDHQQVFLKEQTTC